MAISGLVSKFIDNEYFKKTIISEVMIDKLNYKNEKYVRDNLFKNIITKYN